MRRPDGQCHSVTRRRRQGSLLHERLPRVIRLRHFAGRNGRADGRQQAALGIQAEYTLRSVAAPDGGPALLYETEQRALDLPGYKDRQTTLRKRAPPGPAQSLRVA